MRRVSLILLWILTVAGSLEARTTWFVDVSACPGPGSGTRQDPFCEVQRAIDAASDGDEILVLPGIYVENVVFSGKAVTLRSDADGDPATHDLAPGSTVLDGRSPADPDLRSVVSFLSGEGRGSVLEGFELTAGTGWRGLFGGGIYCKDASPCIDIGLAGDACCAVDLAGNPRQLDGRLDRVRLPDMGAREFDNIHLQVAGDPRPGGSLTIDISGTGGLPVILLVGGPGGTVCHDLFGCLFIDFTSAFQTLAWPPIPSTTTVSLPGDLPAPLPLVFQSLALAGGAGNGSNPVAVTIE